jgi:large subunit ribosomal protein L4
MPILSLDFSNSKMVESPDTSYFKSIKTYKLKPNLVSEVVRLEMMNLRHSIAHTKTRAEVSGGGKKPWKQKGTGRARHGSIRSPIWVGGGVTFGPRNTRVWHRKINSKARISAIKSILADRYHASHLVMINELNFAKTKESLDLTKIFNFEKKVSLAIIYKNEDKFLLNGFRNIQGVDLINVENISLFRLANKPFLMFTEASANFLTARLEVSVK